MKNYQTKMTFIRRGILASLFSILILFSTHAQQKVNADDIMNDLKQGKSISYNGTIIVGVLDFTFMDEKLPELDRKFSWWRSGGDNSINEVIDSKISFVNCTFQDNVIAYYHDDRTEYTFTADFERSVSFVNCTFRENAMFKYSEFEREVSFKGSDFQEASTFKYAEFEDDADFSSTIFDEEATFKYAKFNNLADFSNTSFDKDATFKYSNFRDGVSFNNAKFNRSLNFKYTKVNGIFDIDKMNVRDDIDSKYTSINGRSFSRYVFNSRD